MVVDAMAKKQDQPLPPASRDRLRAFVEEHGQYEAARRLDIGSSTLVRALAGLGVRRATKFVIETQLAQAVPEQAAS